MIRRTSVPIVLLLLLIAAPAISDESPEFRLYGWLDSLAIDPGTIAELQRFSADEGDWPEGSEERLAAMFRARVLADVARAARSIADGKHEPYVRVSYLEPGDFARGGQETQDKRGRKFEEGVIRTEQVGFLAGEETTPLQALSTFVDPGFRKQTSSRIEEINEEDGLSCIRTKGMWGLLDPTSTCNQIHILDGPDVAAEHSQVVDNPDGEDFQSIYFKESVKIFFATPSGLAFYYINYTRSSKLGSLKKKFGRGKIEDSQRERVAALVEALKAGGD